MPYYKPLETYDPADRIRIITSLQALRASLKAEVPIRTNRSTLLISTWNIREFSNCENRCDEAFWYIGEIISFFDLIALQEIGNDLSALRKIMDVLGYKFDYIVTDTPNVEGGNERMAFVFNIGKVKFKNVAGEINLDHKEREDYKLPEGFARPPFNVAFQASWFKFNLCNVHIYYGYTKKDGDGVPDDDRRRREIAVLANKLNARAIKEDSTYILMGDFNIEEKGDKYYNALIGDKKPTGFYINPKKEEYYTNAKENKQFDQIAFNMHNVSLVDLNIEAENKEVKMGVVNFYEHVFNKADIDHYREVAKKLDPDRKERYDAADWDFETWRTFQMSDHLPFWMELKIDFTDQYLETLKTKKPEKKDGDMPK